GSKTASSHEHRAWLTVGLTVSLLLAYFSHPVTFVLTADAVSLQALLIFRGKNLSSLISAGIPIGIIVSAYALAEARSDVVSMSWSYEALQSRIANAMLPFGGFVDAITN